MTVGTLMARLSQFSPDQKIIGIDGNNGMFFTSIGSMWEQYFDEDNLQSYDPDEDVEGLDVERVVMLYVE